MSEFAEKISNIYRIVRNIGMVAILFFGSWQIIQQLLKLNSVYSDYEKSEIYKKIFELAAIIILSLIIVWFIFSKFMM